MAAEHRGLYLLPECCTSSQAHLACGGPGAAVWFGLRTDLARTWLPTVMCRELEVGKSVVLRSSGCRQTYWDVP